jgi:hypothetical protein
MSNMLTDDQFIEKYRPIENTEGDFLFETYGSDLARIKTTKPDHVWTLVEVEGIGYLIPGIHYVNRFGYFITELPWTDEEEAVLWWDDNGEDD